MHIDCMALLFLTDVKPKIKHIRIQEKEPLADAFGCTIEKLYAYNGFIWKGESLWI